MSMKKCKECGSEISSSAKVCPKCGKKLRHTGIRVFAGIVVIFIGICCAISINQNNTTPTGSGIVQEQTKVTLEKFNKIETGMTYQQVVDIIGEEGTLSTESSYGNQSMKVYYWYASNKIANATVSFMNDKVTAKSQVGL